MTLARTTEIFFDASCLVAAAGSPNGGSGFLLAVCARGFLRALTSQPVLAEAQQNIVTKLPATAVDSYHALLELVAPTLVSVPPPGVVASYELAVREDAHVVAAALAAGAPYLLTLDRRLVRRIIQASYPIAALTPGDFIQGLLPTHADYPVIRQS